MNGLSCGEESMTICSAVLIGCQRVTDRQTDVQPISITCFSIADARNKTVGLHRKYLLQIVFISIHNCIVLVLYFDCSTTFTLQKTIKLFVNNYKYLIVKFTHELF